MKCTESDHSESDDIVTNIEDPYLYYSRKLWNKDA